MKFKPHKIESTLENTFEGDLLNRKQYTDVVS